MIKTEASQSCRSDGYEGVAPSPAAGSAGRHIGAAASAGGSDGFSRCFRGWFRLQLPATVPTREFPPRSKSGLLPPAQPSLVAVSPSAAGFSSAGFCFRLRRPGRGLFGRVHPAVGKFKDVTLMHQPVQIGDDGGLFRRRLSARRLVRRRSCGGSAARCGEPACTRPV